MYISKETREALNSCSGKGYKLKCGKENKRLQKQEYLLNYLQKRGGGKLSVLDIGCAGHLKNIDEQMANGTWLHGRIDKVTTENWGIDINKEAIDYLQSKYERNDVFYANILTDSELVHEQIKHKVDYLLLLDVIEHTADPVGFLEKIKNIGISDKMIITVPNALCLLNFLFAYFKNSEVINNDHKFWFTPFTLCKCINEAGWDIEELNFCDYNIKGHKLPRVIANDIMANTLFAVCTVKK